MPTTIGLISDTHGLVRPSAMHALEGVELILHAGDVGSRDVLIELGVIAPVYAVFGNVDDIHMPGLEAHQWLEVEGWRIHVSHGHELGRPSPQRVLQAYGEAGLLVFGHTHQAVVHRDEAHVVVNPGAAGPRRFDVAPSLARVQLAPGACDVELVPLD